MVAGFLPVGLEELFGLIVIGVTFGAVYAIAASGLVVTYTTSGVFNFGHGAIGMIVAFTYWELSVKRGLPTWLALILCLFVIAPAIGLLLERVLFRRLSDASIAVSLVVTTGLMVLALGIGQTIWKPTETRVLPEFFDGNKITVFNVNISYHQLITILVGIGVAVGLRVLLYQTRLGISMRAVVDNRDLAAQNGVLPERASSAAWAIGVMLAGVSGLLLAPALTLDHIGLTLLVINGYAAAIFGQLKNLPRTYIGAMTLGLAESLTIGYTSREVDLPGGISFDLKFGKGWLGSNTFFGEILPVLPILLLFAVLVFLPQERLSIGRVTGAAWPRVPKIGESSRAAAAFIGVVVLASFVLSENRLPDATFGLSTAMIMCSLVLLSGYGGQIALCQLSFAGVGAFVVVKMFAGGPIWGVFVAGAITSVIGAIVAIPALRLQNLYLALATFAVALFMDKIVFDHPRTFNGGLNVFIDDFNFGPLDLTSERAKFIVAGMGFAAFGVFVLWLRSGPFGRRLAAMSDSPAASATLGMSILGTKVAAFGISAGMAGMAGGMMAFTRAGAGATEFNAVRSLLIFLLATIGGLTSITGAFIGGMALPVLEIVSDEVLDNRIDLQGLFIGGGAILISRFPNGVAGILFDQGNRLLGRRSTASDEPIVEDVAIDEPTLVD